MLTAVDLKSSADVSKSFKLFQFQSKDGHSSFCALGGRQTLSAAGWRSKVTETGHVRFWFCVLHAGIILPYPPDNLVLDVVLMLIFLGLEALRIFYGETVPPLLCQVKIHTEADAALNVNSYILVSRRANSVRNKLRSLSLD